MASDVRLALEDGTGVLLLEYTALLLEDASGNILMQDEEGILLLEWTVDGRLSSQPADPEGLQLQGL